VVRASEGTPAINSQALWERRAGVVRASAVRIPPVQTLVHYPRAGDLQAVASRGFRAGAERKVRAPTGSMLANGEARRRDGKCNRKQTAGLLRRAGKGERVR